MIERQYSTGFRIERREFYFASATDISALSETFPRDGLQFSEVAISDFIMPVFHHDCSKRLGRLGFGPHGPSLHMHTSRVNMISWAIPKTDKSNAAPGFWAV